LLSQGIHSKYMSNILYVGIDIASKSNVAAMLNEQNACIKRPFQFPNNQTGVEELEQTLVKVASEQKVESLLIGTEATSFYDWHLVDYLAESSVLLPFKPELYRFNPKLIKNFKQALKDQGKTDAVDALAIARRLKLGDLPKAYHSLKAYLPLQRLTRYRSHLVREISREKNYVLTQLFLKNSSLTTEKPVKRVLGATSRAVIHEYLTAEEVAQESLEGLTSLIIKASKNRYADPKRVAKLVQKASRESYRIRPKLAQTLDLIISSSFRTIRSLQESLKQIDKAIRDELQGFQHTLMSVPGIGPVYAAGILAEIGELPRFNNDGALAKYAGLWWPKHQSGDFEAEETSLRRSGNTYLRYYLVEAANSLRVHNEIYQKFYQTKYQEVRKHQHKRALVLTARKLVRLVFALLKTGQLWDEARYNA